MRSVQAGQYEEPRHLLSSLRFRHPWRDYQARVLHELDGHLADERLHVVAAPGSGKTILGLEIIRRLRAASLILVPSLTIREQWIQRFCEDFALPTRGAGEHHGLINQYKYDDSFLKVETYQWLHQQVKADSGYSFARFELIVLDEAHHLRQVWWRSLEHVLKPLERIRLVALTATPPLGASAAEWNRYRSLCGPIDAEISIPELVKSANLCPHQDYLFLTRPESSEMATLDEARSARNDAMGIARASPILLRAVLGHPLIGNCENNMQRIHREAELFVAMLSFLNSKKIALDPIYDALGFTPSLGDFGPPQLEILINDLLRRSDQYFLLEGDLNRLQRELSVAMRQKGHRFRLKHTAAVEQGLLRSRSKLRAIEKIIEHERSHLHSDLRMLVLTTYIRKQYLSWQAEQLSDLDQLGVVPITLALVSGQARVDAVSGSVVLAPRAFAEQHVLMKSRAVPLRAHPHYVSITADMTTLREVIAIVSSGFRDGKITVLVGTVSLLGEGWDEPAVNSLILATQSTSYVQTNQLRGRAMRISAAVPSKTANIWHLACIDPTQADFGPDIKALRDRFQSVVGLHHQAPRIESGFHRLACNRLTSESMQDINRAMLAAAGERATLGDRWLRALGDPKTEDRDFLEERVYLPLLPAERQQGTPLTWFDHLRLWFRELVRGEQPVTMVRIAEALLHALKQRQLIDSSATLSVTLTETQIVVALENANKFDQELYLNAISELIERNLRARYVVSFAAEIFNVPKVLQKLQDAQVFLQHWIDIVGPAELIYTSSAIGKRHWLQALARANINPTRQPIRHAVWVGNESAPSGVVTE